MPGWMGVEPLVASVLSVPELPLAAGEALLLCSSLGVSCSLGRKVQGMAWAPIITLLAQAMSPVDPCAHPFA
jgi:hypothetical protein